VESVGFPSEGTVSMADEDVFIFLSYAHDDDLATGASEDEVGFVTFLNKMLELKLQDLGATRAKIWIDRRRISDGDLFDDVINDGLRKADLLVVVMSPNWMQRPYCREELEAFADLCKKSGIVNVHERIVVVGKGHVDRRKRPFDLQGQEGFLFYSRDDTNGVRDVTPFFDRGKATAQYYDQRDRLATFLKKQVDRIAEGSAVKFVRGPQKSTDAWNGRVVYLAKPAIDMTNAYDRLKAELQSRGYGVVPDSEIHVNSDAAAHIDAALATADVSVHLLGERRGFLPESGELPIVSLQLARARQRETEKTKGGFRRIIWAPKNLDEGRPPSESVEVRDLFEVLARFDEPISSDAVGGDTFTKFVQFLTQYLAEAPAPSLRGNSLTFKTMSVHPAVFPQRRAITYLTRGQTSVIPTGKRMSTAFVARRGGEA
jgi:TIR domain